MTVICLLQIIYFEYLYTSWFKRKCSQRQQIIGIFSFKWNSPSSGFQWKCWGESMASPEHWNDEWKHTAKLDIYSKLPAFTPWKVTFLLPVQEIKIISLSVHIQNPTRSQCKHKFPYMFSSMWSSAQIHVQPKKIFFGKEVVILNLNQKLIHLFRISNFPRGNCPYSPGEEHSSYTGIILCVMTKILLSSVFSLKTVKDAGKKNSKCAIMKS